jgi:phage tail-like protein
MVSLVTVFSSSSFAARVDPYKSFNFTVQFDGAAVGGFTEVSGLGLEVEVIEYREGSDGNVVRKLPGLTKYNNITLKRGYIGDTTLSDWINSFATGSDDSIRKDITINLADDAGDTIRNFNLTDCFPIAWNLSPLTLEEQVPLTEELVLSCDIMQIQ